MKHMKHLSLLVLLGRNCYGLDPEAETRVSRTCLAIGVFLGCMLGRIVF